MSAVAVFERVISDLRGDGYHVREIAGWRTRGIGTLRLLAQLWHHTAGSIRGNTPSLALVINGASRGLPNALGNFYIARDATIYVIAAKGAWHAGTGVLVTNNGSVGTECENTGTGEPWRSYGSQVALAAALERHSGHGSGKIWDHKEHTTRKIDREGISPSQFRQDVRNFKGRTTGAMPLEEDMFRLNDKHEDFEDVQDDLNFVLAIFDLYRTVEGAGGRWLDQNLKLKVDGVYGPASKKLVRHLKRKVLNRPIGKASGAEISSATVNRMVRMALEVKGRAHSYKTGQGGHVE